MKRFIAFIVAVICLAACQKAPFLTMDGPRSYTFTDQGGSQSFSFSCNRDWTVSSSEPWLKISPLSGSASDGDITVTITCGANSSYDPRTCSVVIMSEGLSETISVSQDMNLGLIISPTSYELSNAAQTISVEVQSNIEYAVLIGDDAKDWISQVSTKGLVESIVSLSIAENDGYMRTGRISFKSGELIHSILIVQKSRNVFFEDADFKAYCVDLYDLDQDGEISLNEALSIKHIESPSQEISSFKGIEDFVNLNWLEGSFHNLTHFDANSVPTIETLRLSNTQITTIDVSMCKALKDFHCNYGILSTLIVNGCESLDWIVCESNNLSTIDVSGCPSLRLLYCTNNHLSKIDLGEAVKLEGLECGENNLSELDINACPSLDFLVFSHNPIDSIDLSHCLELTRLACNWTNLTSLDLSNNSKMERVSCLFNPILKEIWLKTGQTVDYLAYDSNSVELKYKN